MVKVRYELVKNKLKDPVYCEILYSINSGKHSATQLSKKLNKSRIAVTQQLQKLEKDGFVKRLKNSKGSGNVVYFKINRRRITEEFVNLLLQKSEVLNEYLENWFQDPFINGTKIGQQYQLEYVNKKLKYQELFKENRREEIITNPLLVFFFEEKIKYLSKQKFSPLTFVTVFDLFEYLLKEPNSLDYFYTNEDNKEMFRMTVNNCPPKSVFQNKKLKQDWEKENFSSKEQRILMDYFFFLPDVLDWVGKNKILENATHFTFPLNKSSLNTLFNKILTRENIITDSYLTK